MNFSLLNNSNIVSESIFVYWSKLILDSVVDQPTMTRSLYVIIPIVKIFIVQPPTIFSFINVIIPISIVDFCCLVLSIYVLCVPFHILHSRFKISFNFPLMFERMLKISIYTQFTYTTCTAPSRHILLIATHQFYIYIVKIQFLKTIYFWMSFIKSNHVNISLSFSHSHPYK